MPTRRKRPPLSETEAELVAEFDRAYLAYQDATIEVAKLKHNDEIELMVELVAYRGATQVDIQEWFGHASREAASKRIRPALAERGLKLGGPFHNPNPESNGPYWHFSNEELVEELLENHEKIPPLEQRVAEIRMFELAPAAARLIDVGWSINRLAIRAREELAEVGGPALDKTLQADLSGYWLSRGTALPRSRKPVKQ